MRKENKDYFTEEEYDSFLKSNFGYGIKEFKSSLVMVYSLFIDKTKTNVYKVIEKRIRSLEKIKENITEMLDNFLDEADYYKTPEKDKSKKDSKWTTQKRRGFIEKYYRISPISSVIDGQIQRYNKYMPLFKPSLDEKSLSILSIPLLPIKVLPLTLLILTWSHAMIRGKRRNWVEMVELLDWFKIRLSKLGIPDIFCLKTGEITTSDLFRLYWNRYKKSNYIVLSRLVYDSVFLQTKYKKIKSSFQLSCNLKELLTPYNRSAEEWIRIIDILALKPQL